MDLHCSVAGCGLPMTMPGGVVISPPIPNESTKMITEKYHICVLCWTTKFMKLFDGESDGWEMNGFDYSYDIESHTLMSDGEPIQEFKRFVRYPTPHLEPLTRYVKDPTVESLPPKLDVVAVMAQAYRNKVEAELDALPKPVDNHLVEAYCYTDAELLAIMSKQSWFHAYPEPKTEHPIWDLIKRGWL